MSVENSQTNSDLPPSSRVRLKGDPSRVGITTGRTRPGRKGREARLQTTFPDGTSWVPRDQLELVPSQLETPIDLLQAGKLGRAIDFRRTMTHVRLTGRLADVIYSMEATNTDFYAYQFKPVLRFLMSPSNAMLIADEVGLGKTIEAGLIWTELKSRFDYGRLLILCPAILREKWQRELANKIGVTADIVDAQGLLKRLQQPMTRHSGFALICSLQGARPHRDWQETTTPNSAALLARFLREKENEDPLFDLLIIDEAHYLRNPESQTNELGRIFRPVSENLLLLSATPIHNYSQDLFSLLQLLDADTFERIEDLGLILEASRPLVEARDHILRQHPSRETVRKLVEKASRHSLLRDNRQLKLALAQLNDSDILTDPDERASFARRLETVNPLAYVITRTRKRHVKEWRVVRDPVPERIPMNSFEDDFYRKVTEHVIDYAMKQDANMRFLLATPQRQMSSSMAATLRAWRRKLDNSEDDDSESNGDSSRAREIGPLTQSLIEKVDVLGSVEDLMANDSKFARVREMLTKYFKKHPNEKVVLFSTFRETLNYLGERFESEGIANLVMHGGVRQSKQALLQRFESDPSIRILLSSEVGSEGVDLQFCRLLVNYDLPWNPMRVEQRIGRLDRLGQKAQKILIWNLFYDDTIDARIYERLYDKLDLCRQALGDFEAVLGDEIRKLTTDLLSDHLTIKQQEVRIDQTTQAFANLKQEQDALENEASHLVAYGDYILNQVQAARELNRWITGTDLRIYVTDFFGLHYPGCSFQQLDGSGFDFDIQLSNEAKQNVEAFAKSERLPATRLVQNVARPVRCRFENRIIHSADGPVECITQFHPVVRFISREIREGAEQIRPAVSLQLDRTTCDLPFAPGTYALCVSRWSVEGLQSVEKLAFAHARIGEEPVVGDEADAERLVSACAAHATDWFEARNVIDLERCVAIADNELFGRLEERFDAFVEDVRRQNEDRADLQLKTLHRHLDNQRRKLEAVREKHRLFERESLVKATEGRIQALENRIQRKQLEIGNRRNIRYYNEEVLVALVKII